MYSLYQPVLSSFTSDIASAAGSSAAADGYQLLAAASEGQLTLTEVTTKTEKSDDDDVDNVQNQVLESGVGRGTELDLIVTCTCSVSE